MTSSSHQARWQWWESQEQAITLQLIFLKSFMCSLKAMISVGHTKVLGGEDQSVRGRHAVSPHINQHMLMTPGLVPRQLFTLHREKIRLVTHTFRFDAWIFAIIACVTLYTIMLTGMHFT